MSNPNDVPLDASFDVNEWGTIFTNSPDVTYYMSDGSVIELRADDDKSPSNYIAWHFADPETDEAAPIFETGVFPRADAMKAVRAWYKSRGLLTVPSEAQLARYNRMHGSAVTALELAGGLPTVVTPRFVEPAAPEPDPAPTFDPIAFARELDAMKIAAELDVMLKGGNNG